MSAPLPTVTTLIISDIHLTTAEPPDPSRPLWKRYKHPDLFVDDSIERMLHDVRLGGQGPLELVLNGDIFDFDAVTDIPARPTFRITALERVRGLAPTEAKSLFKFRRILDEHPVFVRALREWLRDGHSLVIVTGNHDLELHWPAVQRALREYLDAPEGDEVRGGARLSFCEWFYRSQEDTLIEHGNQYDSYCLCQDPLSPTIVVADEERIRLPFGSYAARVLTNGMGMINPHADQAWIMSFWGYVLFFWRHVIRVQPLMPLTWMWSSFFTLWLSVRDGFEPAVRDILGLEDRVEAIAARARATPRMVRTLMALRAHAAFFTPWRIARELWLDRFVMSVLIALGSFELLATAKVFMDISFWWWFGLLGILFPPFLSYARSVTSEANHFDRAVARRIELIAAIVDTNRVVFGHTHQERHTWVGGVEVLNPGTWSPAFEDAACTRPVGNKCAVWIRPVPGGAREASVEVWHDPGWERLPLSETAARHTVLQVAERLFGPLRTQPLPQPPPRPPEGSTRDGRLNPPG